MYAKFSDSRSHDREITHKKKQEVATFGSKVD